MNADTPPKSTSSPIRAGIRLERSDNRNPVIAPDGSALAPAKFQQDDTLIAALVKAHCWKRRIESGAARSITDLAEQEGVADTYVLRLLQLTALAPDIAAAILDGRQPKGLRLADLLRGVPLGWEEQRHMWS